MKGNGDRGKSLSVLYRDIRNRFTSAVVLEDIAIDSDRLGRTISGLYPDTKAMSSDIPGLRDL